MYLNPLIAEVHRNVLVFGNKILAISRNGRLVPLFAPLYPSDGTDGFSAGAVVSRNGNECVTGPGEILQKRKS